MRRSLDTRGMHIQSGFYIQLMTVIGGVDIKDSVWRVMKHCFSNSLAKQLNWRGINGKTAFHRLRLKDVITEIFIAELFNCQASTLD
ncbi:hypothetical protein SKAU_G00423500 [Synaphobranchus kaupii]|uniref:DUF4806 domain-containing protein n=1 Tax=Synaphobranchus kaupii TaxID=118154 RepID=A0A9Q1E5E4_SYNKA|nr:hypothetical protein SKAU_G00423500 [Synaphobranchus kaupii]